MKIRFFISYLILFSVFAASLWPSDAAALTCLFASKTVSVDENWQITGRYVYEFELLHPEDAIQIDHLIQQFSPRTDTISTAVLLPDGRETAWTAIDKNKPPAGASVRIELTISNIFPGFKGLFADCMQIDQTVPVKKAAYRITFPEKMAFACRLAFGDGKGDHCRAKELFNDEFSWSGHNIRRLDLSISTATSWDQIRDRYQALFQRRIGNEFPGMADLPTFPTRINTAATDDQKIQEVMNYFKTHFDYQQHARQGHGLLPDDPAVVMHRGWGDCKDIALLETLVLQSMGIDAFVVLSGDPAPESSIPDPFIFDHAMVGVDSNGRIAYYDSWIPGNSVAANTQNIYLHLKVTHDTQ